MSWDATLLCDCCGSELIDINYTHNTNRMINEALSTAGVFTTEPEGWWAQALGVSWIDALDGMSGPDGARLLNAVIGEFKRDPEKYRVMNPENGWGSYDRLLPVLTAMRDSVPETLTHWHVSG